MSKIYVLNYNNYGNRIVKRESTLAAYLTADPDYRVYADINFYRGDGVNTTQTVNFPVGSTEKEADYLIVTNTVNNVESIVSRWFIIECNYNRKQQLIFTLRRDLIVDYWDSIYTNAVTDGFFCEKGSVSATDNFIFNPENMTFNQVMERMDLLETPGHSGAGYIVGYLDKKASSLQLPITEEGVIAVNTRDDIPVWYAFTHSNGMIHSEVQFNYSVYAVDGTSTPPSAATGTAYYVDVKNSNLSSNFPPDGNYGSSSGMSMIGQNNLNSLHQGQGVYMFMASNNTREDINEALEMHVRQGYSDYNDYSYMSGSVYYIKAENKFYQITLSRGSRTSYQTISGGYENSVGAIVFDKWKTQYPTGWVMEYGNSFPIKNIKFRYYETKITFTDVSSNYTIGNIPIYSDRLHTDKPYDIFIAPATSTTLSAASRIATALYGSGMLYDIQLLPYVPTYPAQTGWTILNATFYWLTSDSRAETSIALSPTYTYPENNNVQAKVDALTKKWRIVSPNHANAWDFSPAANKGVNEWYYEITLKPYQPYIHVYPKWNVGGLYKGSGDALPFDDRGLVCTGSFSLAVSTDAWSTYQINNSSYQSGFERQIENLNVNQDAQRTMQKWSIAAGAVSAATQGAVSGGTAGGAVGAAVGGAVAGIGSLITGIADYQINEKLRNEAIDYTRDQFSFSLQNIQAQPNVLSKSSSFDVNSAISPYVEMYWATEEEENALKAKIKRNGMTIMRIGSFKEFWNNATSTVAYIKGKLIRMPSSFKEDTHIFNEIANELYKGVYKY